MNDRVKISVSDHIADVMLDRAEKMNAMDIPMFHALVAAADEVAADASVRAVVLHGAGGNLCAGIDTSVLSEADFDFVGALRQPLDPSPANLFQRAAYAWRELKVPVICVVEGTTFGAGLQLALGADIRFAAANARVSIMEAKWGLIPDMGISATARQLCPPDRIKELAWTARVFSATEAADYGLVTTIADDPQQAAFELAERCVNTSPDAIRGVKQLVNLAWNIKEREALALEAQLQERIIGGKNQMEAVAANIAQRKPRFHD